MSALSSGKKLPSYPFFLRALKLAKIGAKKNEVPIGAVLVRDGEILASAHNQTESRGTFLAHAEILCIERACKKLKTKFLNDCELYVTLEPCRMCHAAGRLSRLKAIHFLAASEKFGRRGLGYFPSKVLKSRSKMTLEAVELLQAFFKDKR